MSLFASDLASNCLVRVYPIARALARTRDVEVVGPLFGGDEVFAPFARELPYRVVRAPNRDRMRASAYRGLARELAGAATGSLAWAFKATYTSYGAALLMRRRTRRPVVLDLEDWDAHEFHRFRWRQRLGRWNVSRTFRDHMSPHALALMELLVRRADRVVVSSTYLQRKFGGVRIMQGADCEALDPGLVDASRARDRLGVADGAFVVLFTGTVLPHKGLEDLAQAAAQVEVPAWGLVTLRAELP